MSLERTSDLWASLRAGVPVVWRNPRKRSAAEAIAGLRDAVGLDPAELDEARDAWASFAPLLRRLFPETGDGTIVSPLVRLDRYRSRAAPVAEGTLLLKCDHALPVAGSIKARGGLFEVLAFARTVARSEGLLPDDGAPGLERLAERDARAAFSRYTVAVGSTGNLGLSIGIAAAALGFRAVVHMSRDAKAWKKRLLREKGAIVVEHDGDFNQAVAAGRKACADDPAAYFVDDERSRLLFLGYAAAAFELGSQLREAGVPANEPANVYLPCGVGGSPCGIAFGLKALYGDRFRCWLVEPTGAPGMLAGLLSGEQSMAHIERFGIRLDTEADGLAVPSPSALASPVADALIEGIVTTTDAAMYAALRRLYETEAIRIEPSAAASLSGLSHAIEDGAAASADVHIGWSTGGSLLPEDLFQQMLAKGRDIE